MSPVFVNSKRTLPPVATLTQARPYDQEAAHWDSEAELRERLEN